jgi:hypothetical protein
MDDLDKYIEERKEKSPKFKKTLIKDMSNSK